MKTSPILTALIFWVGLLWAAKGMAQLQIDNSPATASCNLGNFGAITISVPHEALTGDNIPLNITLPGTIPASCVKTVTVTHSAELQYQGNGAIAFDTVPGDPFSYQNSDPLNGNDGQNFNLFFRFPPYVTCNGTAGTLTVTVTVDCGGEPVTCSSSVTVTGRAANYWSVSKHFVSGNLTCGISYWRIYLTHNNPNPAGLGTYSVQGTFTENPTVPVVSGAVTTVNVQSGGNGSYLYNVALQNCAAEGTAITNVVDYNLTLGGGCDSMAGTVTATSPLLVSPNADINFTKSVFNPNGGPLAPGCVGRYRITLHNNGNVPWTDFVLTDDTNISGITVNGNPSVPAGWTLVNNGGVLTISNPTYVLIPNATINIDLDFAIDASTPIGSIVTNTATLNYQAQGTNNGSNEEGGAGNPSCPEVDCPQIDTSLQHDTASVDFEVVQPAPVPSIRKCIFNAPNTFSPPLYQIGDLIHFRILVGNTGSAALTAAVSDALGTLGQNLQLVPSSVQYEYFPGVSISRAQNGCQSDLQVAPEVPPFSVTSDLTDLQHPQWQVAGLPGSCVADRGNFLAIYFDALVLPQLYGSKTNQATLEYGESVFQASAAYAVDQWGILAVSKAADVETAETGQAFNYLIEVINNGSVPLDSISVTDLLPDCVSIGGSMLATDGQGTPIPVAASGNLQLTIDPAYALQPADRLTLTVPVIKKGGGTCCNPSVSATAVMTTSGVVLSAIYGSEEEPAACVSSVECCDIADFDASLVYRNGHYEVVIQGGSTPIQQVEISMANYDVAYSAADCQPADMGIFGMLSTQQSQWGNLTLQPGDNHTASLTWSPGGTPTVLNGSVVVDVSQPAVLDIECCEVEFSFCLKVRVTDVNCNVCERLLCFSPEDVPEPCTLEMEPVGGSTPYCVGDVVPLNWSGTAPSGAVNIILVDAQTGTPYQVLATGVPNNGSYQFTIPQGFPCDADREWMVVIQDAKGDCGTRSNRFRIRCCEVVACDCGRWLNHSINILEYHVAVPQQSLAKNVPAPVAGQRVDCGGSVRLRAGHHYSFTAPEFSCQPEGCAAVYQWELYLPDGSSLSGTGQTLNHSFDLPGSYHLIFTPLCGGQKCDVCQIKIDVPRVVGPVGPFPPISTDYKDQSFKF